MVKAIGRRRALVTGASGGMGRACARMLGEAMDLVLTDAAGASLADLSAQLVGEGYRVVETLAGDLSDDVLLGRLAAAAAGGAGFGSLIHTAGLSPALASWPAIMQINLIATAKLLDAIEPICIDRSVAVLISSIAGHLAPVVAEADTVLDDAMHPDTIDRIAPVVERLADRTDPRGAEQVSYALSKRAVLRMCERRAAAWASKGARIVSISPGTMWTPMGQREAAENPKAAGVVLATPMGRWGTAMDVAAAARFLCSEAASFITGTDLRVDGGVTPGLRQGDGGR